MNKKKYIERFFKAGLALMLLTAPFVQSLPVFAVPTEQTSESEEKVEKDLSLTFMGEDTLDFRGEGLYTVEFRDSSAKEENEAVYTLVLPKGVELDERAFQTRAVESWDEETRTATLQAPESAVFSVLIPLQLSLDEGVELVVEKTVDDETTRSSSLRIELLEEETQEKGESELQENEDEESDIEESTPVIARAPRIDLNAPVNVPTTSLQRDGSTAFIYNWADFLDAMTNFQITHLVLQNNIAFPSTNAGGVGTAQALATQYASLRGGSTQPQGGAGQGWINSTDRIFWRSTANTPGNQTVPSTGGGGGNGSEAWLGLRRNNAANPHTVPVIIDGQGRYAIDNGGIVLTWHDAQPHTHHIRDLTTFSGNFWGWMTYNDLTNAQQNNSHLIFENWIHHGTQTVHSPQTPITMRGYVAAIQGEHLAFDSPFRPGWWSFNHRFTGFQESNLFAQNLTIEDNAQVFLSSASTGNISLNGHMVVGENALVYLNGSFIGQRNTGTTPETAGTPGGLGGIGDDSMGYGIHFNSTNASLTTGRNSRIFIYSDETRTGAAAWHGGGILFTGANARLSIGDGASVEVFANGNNRTATLAHNRGGLISMSNNSVIEVADYGRLQVFSENMGAQGLPPIFIFGTSTVRIGRNGIFDVTADTDRPLIWTQGTNAQSGNIIFDDAQRVNLHRFGSNNNTNALIGHQQDQGATVLRVANQRISQWDNGVGSAIASRVVTEETQIGQEMHAEPIPDGQSIVTAVQWETSDEGYSREFTPVNAVDLRFQGSQGNATSTNIRTFNTAQATAIQQQLGRSQAVHTATGHSTNGAKPNRILFSKLYELEVQLFSTLTDNPAIDRRVFEGSVTQGFLRGADGGYHTNTDGSYVTFEPSNNSETRSFTFDPRREVIGRTGVIIESVRYIPSERRVERESNFVPIENALVRLDANGSINPVNHAHTSTFHGVQPVRSETIAGAGIQASDWVGTTFADMRYSLRTSDANGIVIPSTGETITGAGFFVYEFGENTTADDLIRVSAFDNGREFVFGTQPRLQSIRVLDETDPLADARNGAVDAEHAMEISHSSTGTLYSPSFFVENLRDSNPFVNYDGFFHFEFDFSEPSEEIAGVTHITSREHFKEIVSDLNITPEERFSIGILVSDPAGNSVRVDTVFYISLSSSFEVSTRDLFIYESSLVGSSISTNQSAMENWLIQQAILSAEFELRDSNDNVVVNTEYKPIGNGNLDEEIFQIVNKNGLFNQQNPGVPYQIEAILNANRANPTGETANGVTTDQPVSFRVMIISDRMSIMGVNDLHFGTHRISALNRLNAFGLENATQLLEVSDPRGVFDTSAGVLVNADVQVNPTTTEPILTGHISSINLITERDNEEIDSTWNVSVAMTRGFEDQNGNNLQGVLHFGEGLLQTGGLDETLNINDTLTYGGGSIQLAQGKSGQGEASALRGRNRISFGANDISVQVPSGARVGDFTAEITYTLTAGPEN